MIRITCKTTFSDIASKISVSLRYAFKLSPVARISAVRACRLAGRGGSDWVDAEYRCRRRLTFQCVRSTVDKSERSSH